MLAIGANDADVEECLRMRGVDRERRGVLRKRFVRAARVPQCRAQIGADVDVRRIEREGLAVEPDGFVIALCVV